LSFFVVIQHIISFILHYFAVCFSTGLTIFSIEKINSDSAPNTVDGVIHSAASSVLLTSEVYFFPPAVDGGRPKRKAPPTVNSFPIDKHKVP